MRVLVVTSCCLKNSLSNILCHLAYIRGLVENGNEVDVISVSEKNQIVDNSVKLPQGANYYTFDDSRLLRFVNPSSRDQLFNSVRAGNQSLKTKVYSFCKYLIGLYYGPDGHINSWLRHVKKEFKIRAEYDLVMSLSAPPYSHHAAHEIIRTGVVKSKKFIEIWEDPLGCDVYNVDKNSKIFHYEKRLINYADAVFYVSPLTLKYQKKIFSDCSPKMEWEPLPYYYKDDSFVSIQNNRYGYFGDFFPQSRNLCPFYNAAKETGIYVDICGKPTGMLESTDKISVNPRLPLDELKIHEDGVNTLVFVCNLGGGQIPGKIYQYAATNKKILFILDGTEDEKIVLKEYFSKFNRFFFCDNTVESIKEAIEMIENNSFELTNSPVEYFSPKNTINRILNKINSLENSHE